MRALQSCLNYLDANAIRYTRTTHPVAYTARDTARAEFIPAHRVAKTVVLRDDNGYVLVVVAADNYVHIEQVRAALGSRTLRKATEGEILDLFPDAEPGAMPPFPVMSGVPVYLDRQIAVQEFIAFPAGTHTDEIHMQTADFCRLARPVIGDFSRPDVWDLTVAS